MKHKKKIVGILVDFDDLSDKKQIDDLSNRSLYNIRKNYIDSITTYDKSITVILIPQVPHLMEDYIDIVDGFIFPGSFHDVDPLLYNEKSILNAEDTQYLSSHKIDFEINMLKRIIDLDKSVLCICAGMQILNVAFGGTLYQDINTQMPNAIEHDCRTECSITKHDINVKDNTMLKQIVGDISVAPINTSHHQSIKKCADGFVINAVSTEDGIIEGIEKLNAKFCIGVQWHPEYHPSPIDKKIFQAFCKSLYL